MSEQFIPTAEWRILGAAIVHHLEPVLPELYRELAKRNQLDQLQAYSQNYVERMRDACLRMLDDADMWPELRNGSLLDCWDQLCIDRGWTVEGGARYFPAATLELRALPATEALATVDPAELGEPEPVITAEMIAQIAVLTADRIIEGLKPPQGDLVIQYDAKEPNRVIGVRRTAPQTD